MVITLLNTFDNLNKYSTIYNTSILLGLKDLTAVHGLYLDVPELDVQGALVITSGLSPVEKKRTEVFLEDPVTRKIAHFLDVLKIILFFCFYFSPFLTFLDPVHREGQRRPLQDGR